MLTIPRRSDQHWNSNVIPERVRERAYTRWVPDGDCWISTYSTASHGYAQIGWQDGPERGVVLAHRAAWEHVNGPMMVGMTLDHLCKDWPVGQCAHGHPNSELYRQPAGKLVCRSCKRTWQARYAAKQRVVAC